MWVMSTADSFLADNDALIAYNKDSRDTGKQTEAPTLKAGDQATDDKVNNNTTGIMMGNVNNTFRDFPPSSD